MREAGGGAGKPSTRKKKKKPFIRDRPSSCARLVISVHADGQIVVVTGCPPRLENAQLFLADSFV